MEINRILTTAAILYIFMSIAIAFLSIKKVNSHTTEQRELTEEYVAKTAKHLSITNTKDTTKLWE